MPRIYELPASAGVATLGAGISPDRPPRIIRGELTGAQSQQPQRLTWTATKRMEAANKMLEDQMKMGRRNVSQWFDAQAAILSEGQLEPKKHEAAYRRLQQQQQTKYAEIKAKAEAQAYQIKSMMKLVDTGTLTSEQMEQTMFVMAGVPAEHVRATYAKIKPQKPSAQLNEIDSQLKKIAAFMDQFDDYRDDPWWKPGKKGTIWYTPKIGGKETGPKRRIKESETELLQALDDAKSRAAELRRAQAEIFKTMTPMEQYARRGSRAVDRFALGGDTPQGALGIGDMQIPEPAPAKPKHLTEDIAIAILKEAGGDKLRATQIARSRGYEK